MNCVLRHPRACKFFSNFGRWKFNYQCAYLHSFTRNQTLDFEIRELGTEIMKTKEKIKDVENLQIRIDKLETNLKASEESDTKILENVHRFEGILKEQIQSKSSEKKNQISELREKVSELRKPRREHPYMYVPFTYVIL